MLSLDAFVNVSQSTDQLLLLVLLPEHRGHLFLQRADDVGMNLQMEDMKLFLNVFTGKTILQISFFRCPEIRAIVGVYSHQKQTTELIWKQTKTTSKVGLGRVVCSAPGFNMSAFTPA